MCVERDRREQERERDDQHDDEEYERVGRLLMVTGVELLVRLLNVPQLGLTLLLAWIQAVIGLAGAFLIVNERVVREA